MRFKYNKEKVVLSSLEGNIPTTDKTQYFKFEEEFASALGFFTVIDNEPGLDPTNTFRAVFSFEPSVVTGEHIKEIETIRRNASCNRRKSKNSEQ